MDLLPKTNRLLRDIESILPVVILSERTRAELRQTIYHALERAYLEGYDTAVDVATDVTKKLANSNQLS